LCDVPDTVGGNRPDLRVASSGKLS